MAKKVEKKPGFVPENAPPGIVYKCSIFKRFIF